MKDEIYSARRLLILLGRGVITREVSALIRMSGFERYCNTDISLLRGKLPENFVSLTKQKPVEEIIMEVIVLCDILRYRKFGSEPLRRVVTELTGTLLDMGKLKNLIDRTKRDKVSRASLVIMGLCLGRIPITDSLVKIISDRKVPIGLRVGYLGSCVESELLVSFIGNQEAEQALALKLPLTLLPLLLGKSNFVDLIISERYNGS